MRIDLADKDKFFGGNMEIIFELDDPFMTIIKTGGPRTEDGGIIDLAQRPADQGAEFVGFISTN